MKNNKNFRTQTKIIGSGEPKISIIACIHGDETIGIKILKELEKLKIKKGTLTTMIAHPYAVKEKKKYIKKDLNRSFPGNKNGKDENGLAYKILKEIKPADYVIDIHSTITPDTKNVVIIKHRNQKVKNLIKIINPQTVLFAPKGIVDGSLINHCKAGISLEYGQNEDKDTFLNSLTDIKKILSHFEMIEPKKTRKIKQTLFLQIQKEEKKPENFTINKKLKNLKLFKKGDIIGWSGDKEVVSKNNFYPVLFGKNNYENIIGFKAKKIKYKIT